MKKLLSTFIFSLLCLTAFADSNRIEMTLTITNLPVTTNAINFSAPTVSLRTWTNSDSATTILTNQTLTGAATNLYYHFAANPVGAPRLDLRWLASNSFKMIGNVDQGLACTLTGTWATVTFVTNPVTPLTTVQIPIASIKGSTNQTRVASELVKGMSDISTNSFATGSVAMANFTDLTSVQRAANKYCTNCILDNFKGSNGVNYGSAFSSPGTNTGSEQFGSGAIAQGTYSTAVGNTAVATGDYSIALGAGSAPTAYKAIAIGNGSQGDGTNSIAIGVGASASKYNAIAIGNNAQSVHSNSVAIGVGVVTTAESQVMLGSSTVGTVVSGILQAGTITNSTMTGSNNWQGDLSFPVNRNGSLANGNNADVLITNVWTKFGGPSGAFTNAGFNHLNVRDGLRVRITNTNGFPMAFLNESGLEATPARRFKTGTGSTVVFTNSPCNVWCYYDGDISRWVLELPY